MATVEQVPVEQQQSNMFLEHYYEKGTDELVTSLEDQGITTKHLGQKQLRFDYPCTGAEPADFSESSNFFVRYAQKDGLCVQYNDHYDREERALYILTRGDDTTLELWKLREDGGSLVCSIFIRSHYIPTYCSVQRTRGYFVLGFKSKHLKMRHYRYYSFAGRLLSMDAPPNTDYIPAAVRGSIDKQIQRLTERRTQRGWPVEETEEEFKKWGWKVSRTDFLHGRSFYLYQLPFDDGILTTMAIDDKPVSLLRDVWGLANEHFLFTKPQTTSIAGKTSSQSYIQYNVFYYERDAEGLVPKDRIRESHRLVFKVPDATTSYNDYFVSFDERGYTVTDLCD